METQSLPSVRTPEQSIKLDEGKLNLIDNEIAAKYRHDPT